MEDSVDAFCKRKNVLVIGAPGRLVQVRTALEGDYEVLSAPNVEQGLMLLQQNLPQAVLLFYSEDTKSGDRLLRYLRKEHLPGPVPVIAVGQPEDELSALTAGAADFMEEPLSPGFCAAGWIICCFCCTRKAITTR